MCTVRQGLLANSRLGWKGLKGTHNLAYLATFTTLSPDRDLQCDFDSPFWETTDCNW